MWVEFVVGSHTFSRRFSPGTPVFPSPQKQIQISKFRFDLDTVDEEPSCSWPLLRLALRPAIPIGKEPTESLFELAY